MTMQDVTVFPDGSISGHNTGNFLSAVLCGTESGNSAGFLFFRSLAREFALAVIRSEEIDAQQMLRSVPPELKGAEYITEEFLKNSFAAFCRHYPDAESVRKVKAEWRDLGKVMLHLAENKQDTDGTKPFVFLAACQHRISESGQAAHIPLGSLLKHCAGKTEVLLSCLKPLRDAGETCPFLQSLLDKKIFQPCLFSAAEAWHFLRESEQYKAHGIPVRLAGLWKTHPKRLKMDLVLDVQKKRGLLAAESLVRFSPGISLGGVPLTEDEQKEIFAKGGGLIRVKGEWVEAETDRVRALLENWQRASGMGMNFIQALRYLSGTPQPAGNGLPELMETDICSVSAAPSFQELLQNWKKAELPPLPENLENCIRPYQRTGVQFLYHMLNAGFGVCLADDMGLGKTLQMITCMALLKRENCFADLPALLIVPASLLNNWQEEFRRFAPDFRTGCLHPSALTSENRAALESDPAEFLRQFDAVLVTYAMVTRRSYLKGLQFPLIVLDEAQQIKTPSSAVSRTVRALRGKRRAAMTGTPIENSLSDLWSLFDFISPGLLESAEHFRSFVRDMEAKKDYSPLQKLVRPFILHRLKTDKTIISDLPEKIERKEQTPLTVIQAKFYRRAAEMMKKDLAAADDQQRNGLILNYLLQFKQICNHPSLFSGNGEFLPERSGKLLRLGHLADWIAQKGEKMLIFTQFREMTEVLHEFLSKRFRRPGLILHGGVPVAQRAELVRQFQSAEGIPFFVISLKAGGTGLNLTAANHVVHFDRWWNPAVENQATDRAFRIGQKQTVMVHKFITPGTLEEKIDRLIDGKKFLADTMLEQGTVKLLTEMSNQELLDFIRLDNAVYQAENNMEQEFENV